MTIGLGTYAFFWQWQTTAPRPLSLVQMIDKAASWQVTVFQICEYPLIETYDDAALAALRRHADHRGVQLELGTRGVRPDHLRRYLDIAGALGAILVRSMVNTADHRPTPAARLAGVSEPADALRRIPPTPDLKLEGPVLPTGVGQILAFDQFETTGGAQLDEGLANSVAGDRVDATDRGSEWLDELIHRPNGILKERCHASRPASWVAIFRNNRIDDRPKQLHLLSGEGGQ
jgi:hypothetical protein